MEHDFNKYDDVVIDIEDVEGVDIKINPDYYIHKAILKAQDCLSKDDIKQGYAQYRQFIEMIEVLTESANMLPENYKEEVDKFINTENAIEQDNLTKSIKIANYKLKLIMKRVFSQKMSTEPLKA